MKIASSLAPVVKFLLFLFYVVARPIALFLDWWLGVHDEGHSAPFNAKDLYTLLHLSSHGARPNSRAKRSVSKAAESDRRSRAPSILDAQSPFLDEDAVMIAQGAIISSKKNVRTITKPTYFRVKGDEIITLDWLQSIGEAGFSRVCVTEPKTERLMGYIVVKEILRNIKSYLASGTAVSELPLYQIYYFKKNDNILIALNQFQSGTSRIGVVTSDGYPESPIIGYFSLEDVLEAIIQEDISDEKDSRHASMSVASALHNPTLGGYVPPVVGPNVVERGSNLNGTELSTII